MVNQNSTNNNLQYKWYVVSQKDVLQKLKTSKKGLSRKEIAKRRDEYGLNKLPEAKGDAKWRIFLRQFKSSLVYVLLGAAIISYLLGDKIDAAIIMLAVLINVIIGFYQENKAQTALKSLKKVVVHRCQVVRHGHRQEINTQDLVPGDIIYISAGDKIPADLRLISATGLKINEAPLTGESTEVEKTNKILSGDLILADQANMAFMGTRATQGEAVGVVVATAQNSAIGQIAEMVAGTRDVATPLQYKLNVFAKKISVIIIIICLLIFIIGLLLGYNINQIFITAVAIAVSAIPEGLLVVVTMILAVGMQRILKQKTLVKHLLAAEILGSTNVICSDKTGTITEGEMRVVEIATLNYTLDFLAKEKFKDKPMGESLLEILNIVALCNNAYIENPEEKLEHRVVRGTPTEKALLLAAENIGLEKGKLDKQEPRLDEIPFDSKWKYMMSLNKDSEHNRNNIYVKGAPEVIMEMSKYIYSIDASHKKTQLTSQHKKKMIQNYENMSKRGLRVLAAGYKTTSLKNKKMEGVQKNDFIFVGLLGIKDPIRQGIRETIETVKQAGIQTVMITGDHKLTAEAIAKELGMAHKEQNILEGKKLAKMNESQLLKQVEDIQVYARVTPKDKLKIVKAWQDKDKVVAMTGDGINDAPALKKANIGIAVGSGTDVAKETADAILLDNNFKTIIAAVKEGRVIYANIKKVILYLLSDSFTEVIIIAAGLVLGWPLALLAAQIIWINLVNDTLPALAMSQEPAEKNIMREKSRCINESVMDKKMKVLVMLISGLSAIGALFLFYIYWQNSGDIIYARTMAFAFVASSTLIYVFSLRELGRPIWQIYFFSNKFLISSVVISALLLLVAIYLPPLQSIFKTTAMNAYDWGAVVGLCLLLTASIEWAKYYFNKSTQ